MVHRSMSNLTRYLQEESYDVFSTEYFLLRDYFKFQINFLGHKIGNDWERLSCVQSVTISSRR